mgnify:CR=1 FL=1
MVHSGTIWTLFLEAGNAEKMLKAKKIDNTFWHYLKCYCLSRRCWEKIEIKDDRWCILTLFETMFFKLELLRKNKKQRLKMLHYLRYLKCVLEVATDEHIFLKARGAKWCILTLIETMFWKLQLPRKFWKQGR